MRDEESASVKREKREKGRNERDSPVESSGSEGNPLSDIGEEKISFDFAFQCDLCGWNKKAGSAIEGGERSAEAGAVDSRRAPRARQLSSGVRLTQHASRDVHTHPLMPLFGQNLARETTPSPDVEQVGRSSNVLVLL